MRLRAVQKWRLLIIGVSFYLLVLSTERVISQVQWRDFTWEAVSNSRWDSNLRPRPSALTTKPQVNSACLRCNEIMSS